MNYENVRCLNEREKDYITVEDVNIDLSDIEELFQCNVVPLVCEHFGFGTIKSWHDCLRDIAYWNSVFNISKQNWSTMCYIVGTHLINEGEDVQDIDKCFDGFSILRMPTLYDFGTSIPRYTRNMCYPALKMMYPVGITKITGVEYSNKIYPSLRVERYPVVYVLRSQLDTFMFVAQKHNGQLLLCYQFYCT